MSGGRKRTGYVYLVSVRSRFGRILRLETTFRDPAVQAARLGRSPRLVGYEFVEDLPLACAQIRAGLKKSRVRRHPRSFRCSRARGRAALARAAQRQAVLRRSRFHPQTGLLVASDIELAGPVTAFSSRIAAELSQAMGEARLDLYLHPFLLGTLAARFHEEQRQSKIPDAYLPEILDDIAWRIFKCRLDPAIFSRLARPSRRERGYLDLARYAFAHPEIPGGGAAQLAQFLRAPEAHLSAVMRGYGAALARAPQVRLRNFLYRLAQLCVFTGLIFMLDAVTDGSSPARFLAGLLFLFVTGASALAFNLYEKPDLTAGLGILTRREVEHELRTLALHSTLVERI